MTHIDSVGQTSSTRSTQSPAKAATLANADFQTFLTMLTAQIRNQDPLSPMDGTEFASQLATFAGVEQQTLTNARLQELIDGSADGKLASYSDWIGKTVQTTAPIFNTGEDIQIDTRMHHAADQAFLIVRDQYGRDVESIALDRGTNSVKWNGSALSSSGGTYTFRVDSHAGGTLISSLPAPASATVEGVELREGDVMLALSGGTLANHDEITAIRR